MSSEDICTQCLEFSQLDDQSESVGIVEECDDESKPWARLVGLKSGQVHDLLPKAVDEHGRYNMHVIGRSKTASFKVDTSPLISNHHCSIYCSVNMALDPSLPLKYRLEAWIEDLSNNGTYINRSATRLSKNVPRLLHQNDEIFFINPSLGKTASGELSAEVMNHAYLLMLFLPSSESSLKASSGGGSILGGLGNKEGDVVGGILGSPHFPRSEGIDRSSTVIKLLNQNRNVRDFYEFKNILGQGACGTVYEGVSKRTGQMWAIKCMDTRKMAFTEGATPADLVREAEMLRSLKNPYVIHLEDIFSDDHNLYLVMELSKGGDLFDRIISKGHYKEDETKVVMKQILEAIRFLHLHKIAHRDLKPENILLQSRHNDLDIKITDFGLAKKADDSVGGFKTLCGTPQYFAPEVLKRQSTVLGLGSYDVQADMWSVGVIMYVMLSGTFPFNEATLNQQIASARYTFAGALWDIVSEDAKDLIRKLLVLSPAGRLSAQQALLHPWFCNSSATTDSELSIAAAVDVSVADQASSSLSLGYSVSTVDAPNDEVSGEVVEAMSPRQDVEEARGGVRTRGKRMKVDAVTMSPTSGGKKTKKDVL